MTKFSLSLALVTGIAFAVAASADTVYFPDGTTVDGVVTEVNANCIAIESGGGRMLVQTNRIARVEKNDKTGTLNVSKTSPWTVKIEKEMREKTGMTQEQREEIVRIIDRLAAEDNNERALSIKRLVALQQEVDVFKFLVNTMSSYGARTKPGVLEVLMAINRDDAIPVVRSCATDQVPSNRAAALKIMGEAKDVASLETIARGMVDIDESVRVAAAAALAATGSKRATPLLIDGLDNLDKRVVNACMMALTSLWSTEESPVKFDAPEGWKSFWAERETSVAEPIRIAQLEPLFVPEPGQYVLVHE
ncbi:MAG: hypothetical protein AMXMBFR82_31260 [Candidatus Hydrogenedentota bacterium]